MNGNLLDYQKIFDCLDVMLFIISPSGIILAINSSVSRRLGYSREDLIGQDVMRLHPPESQQAVLKVLSDIEGKDEVLCSIPIITKFGKHIETETRIYRGTWEGQQVLFGFCADVTEQRNVEKKCAAIFKNSPIPILVSKIRDGTVIDVNDAWCNLMQRSKDEIIGVTTKSLNVWSDYTDRIKILGDLERYGEVKLYPTILMTPQGEDIYGLISGVKVEIDNEDVWITSFVDHTEQKLLEQQLDDIREIALSSALEQLDKQFSSNKFIRVGS